MVLSGSVVDSALGETGSEVLLGVILPVDGGSGRDVESLPKDNSVELRLTSMLLLTAPPVSEVSGVRVSMESIVEVILESSTMLAELLAPP